MSTVITTSEDENAVSMLRAHPQYRGHGKIHELLALGDDHQYDYATDRLSSFDFLLPYRIPHKGRVATMTTIAAKRYLAKHGVRTDLVAHGRELSERLPRLLRGNRIFLEQGTIVRKYEMIPYEIIIRGYVLGSMAKALAAAQQREEATVDFCGYSLPSTIGFGRKIPEPLVTPTTKANKGHDLPVRWQDVEALYPGITAFGRRVYDLLAKKLENEGRGRLLDMKIEVAFDPDAGEFVLCDEISPDSCRFCLHEDADRLANGELIDFYDKEYWRQYLASLGIEKLSPTNKRHQARVARWVPDPVFVTELMRRQEVACEIVTNGFKSREYAADVLGL